MPSDEIVDTLFHGLKPLNLCDDGYVVGVKSISLSSFDKMLSMSIQETPGYPKRDDVTVFRLHIS